MIHNGIEYGMMQAYAEGIALIKGKTEFGIDVAAVAELWRHGSVVRSWLLDLIAEFLGRDVELADIAPVVADSGEGRWTAQEAIEQGVPAPVMSLALMMRFASQGKSDYAGQAARDDAARIWRPRGGAEGRRAMIVVLMGVSGAGKTVVGQALAADLHWPFFDADDFHPPANVAKMAAGTPLTDDDRWPWLDRIAAEMAAIERARGKRRARVLCVEAGVPRSPRARG